MLSGNPLLASPHDTLNSVTPSARLKAVLSSPPPHPMVVLPTEGGFWTDPPPPGVEKKEVDNFTKIANQQYYDNFKGVDHYNYCSLDSLLGPVVLSIKCTQDCQQGCQAEVISRTSSGSRHHIIDLRSKKEDEDNLKDEEEANSDDLKERSYGSIQVEELEGIHGSIPVSHLVQISQTVAPDLDINQLIKLKATGVVEQLLEFDDHEDTNVNKLNFGLIYQKVGQTTEEELFSNQEHSEAMDSFMDMLGTKVGLIDHKGYQGGLHPEDSEEKSLYTQYKNKEIMFHVSTLLPHSYIDPHQAKKKRKIGNDMMSLVFQDGDTPFAPNMIKSQFLNAYIIVRPLDHQQYQVCVAAIDAVKQFEPVLPESSTFDSGPEFRDWLLNKLISGRRACYQSEKFTKMVLNGLVQKLMEEETKLNVPRKKNIKNIKSRFSVRDCSTM